MYKSFTAEEYRKHFDLPPNYSVAGLLSYGAWDEAKHFNKLHRALDGLKIKYTSKKLGGFLSHIYEIRVANKIYWLSLLYGGAMLSEYVHLACLFGSKKNIHIGSCGGLYPKMESLDFLITSYSYGNDSVTRLYARKIKNHKHFSDKNLSKILAKNIKTKNKIWLGPVITCQAMLGETLTDVISWSKNGYYGVEMETSTIFSVSNHFKVPSSALLYVSDNLIKGQTVHDKQHFKQKRLRDKIKNDICRSGLLSLIKSDL